MSSFNCPNCGAPITGDKCEYCGTHFIDCTMDTEKPFYIKIRVGNSIYVDKVFLRNMDREVIPGEFSIPSRCFRGLMRPTPSRITYSLELESVGVNL